MEKLACFLSAIGIGFACLFPITVHAIDVKGTAAESTQEADREGKIRLKVEIVDNTASRDLPADYLWSIKNMVTGRLYSRYPRVDATIEDAAHADAVLKVSVDVFTAGSRVKRLIGLRKAHLKITAEWLEGNPPVVKDSKVFQRFGAAPFRSGRAVEQIMLLLTENYVDDFVFFHKAFLNKRQSLPPMQPGITTVSSGTCFVVSPDGLVLTAYHIVDGAETIKVIMGNGQSLKASLLHYAKSIDLAVLRVNALTPHYLSLSPSREAKVGVSVFTMGFPVKAVLGNEPKFTDGTISALSGPGGEATIFQMSVPVQPGNSGGPIVNDQGQVLGVVTSTAAIVPYLSITGTLPQNINWAVKSDYALPLFSPPSPLPPTPDRESAIERVHNALCAIETTASR